MINVLVADDSALLRRIDCDIINNINGFSVTDIAYDENSAMKKLQEKLFDVLVMNVSLDSKGSGHFMETLRAMKNDTTVVAISYPLFEDRNFVSRFYGDAAGLVVRPFHMSIDEREEYRKKLSETVMKAAGKVMAEKPERIQRKENFQSEGISESRPSMKEKVENDGISESVVFKRENFQNEGISGNGSSIKEKLQSIAARSGEDALFSSSYKPTVRMAAETAKRRKPVSHGPYQLLVLACSTGGPQALHKVVPKITKEINVPFVIIQHMPNGFTAPLAERLSEKSLLQAKEACDGEVLRKNRIYIAPGGRHLQIVTNQNGELSARVYDGAPVNSLKPCADVTIKSITKCNINNILCVVLTGMGMDATTGIAELSAVKNTYVISQDEESSVVYGMPKAVKEAGLSNEVVPLSNIAESIMKKLGVL